jgi:hypothetical protein
MSQSFFSDRPLEVVHCSSAVLADALTPTLTPTETADSRKEALARRPNPANGAPKPAGHNPVG